MLIRVFFSLQKKKPNLFLFFCAGVANDKSFEDGPANDDVNTSESDCSPKIRRKQKRKVTPRHRRSRQSSIATVSNAGDSNDENKENSCPPSPSTAAEKSRSQHKIFEDLINELNRSHAMTPPLRQYIKLNLSEAELVPYLQHYFLSSNEQRANGYPVRYGPKAGFYKKRFSGCVEFGDPFVSTRPFDVNAREFVPSNRRRLVDRKSSCDSGQMSELSASSAPATDSDSSDNMGEFRCIERTEKRCIRCSREFHVNEHGEYLKPETCTYHWGKLGRKYPFNEAVVSYTCCNQAKYSDGCTTCEAHVWNGYVTGFNGPFDDYVCTEDSPNMDDTINVYALDCEMSYTGLGLEVVKVTLVGADGRLIYERLVRPATKVIDYNTRFSGLSKKDFCRNNALVATLPDVQQDLLEFINKDTILIGHALENDLRVLKMIHDTVIDTSITFEHHNGPGFKHSLRSLTSQYLKRSIQNSELGHSSFEDSRACLELMLYRVRRDFRAVLEQ